jgi:lysophospholipase L1-like esterase
MTAISGTKRIAIIGLAVAAALAIAPGAAAAPAVTLTALARVDDSPTTYYLSLGDSLAQGFQPNGDLTHGYAEQFYASLAADQPKLRLVKLGCGGESTVSMRFGSQDPTVVGSCGTPRYYKVLFPKGTQLAEAASFLQAHKGKVALVTIGIGANDLSWRDAQGNDVFCLLEPDGCARRTAVMAENLAAILADLRAAAGPDVPIVGMSYYDVFAPLASPICRCCSSVAEWTPSTRSSSTRMARRAIPSPTWRALSRTTTWPTLPRTSAPGRGFAFLATCTRTLPATA